MAIQKIKMYECEGFELDTETGIIDCILYDGTRIHNLRFIGSSRKEIEKQAKVTVKWQPTPDYLKSEECYGESHN